MKNKIILIVSMMTILLMGCGEPEKVNRPELSDPNETILYEDAITWDNSNIKNW